MLIHTMSKPLSFCDDCIDIHNINISTSLEREKKKKKEKIRTYIPEIISSMKSPKIYIYIYTLILLLK